MKVLAIDFGTKKIGLAIGFRGVIETLPVFKVEQGEQFKKIGELCCREKVDKIVVGVSEGKSARKSQKFAKDLANVLKLPVVLADETLTTHQALELKPQKKEIDSVAAALILENYWLKERRR